MFTYHIMIIHTVHLKQQMWLCQGGFLHEYEHANIQATDGIFTENAWISVRLQSNISDILYHLCEQYIIVVYLLFYTVIHLLSLFTFSLFLVACEKNLLIMPEGKHQA